MAVEIVEGNPRLEDVVLVGIRTRGVPLAEAIAAEISRLEEVDLPIGVLDITLYRDDLSTIGPQPVVRETRLPGSIDGKVLVLCDDVLYTGRTIRAALDALIDYGRPDAVHLAVLVDRVGLRRLCVGCLSWFGSAGAMTAKYAFSGSPTPMGAPERRKSRQVCSITQRPISTIRLESSASGTNSAGETNPSAA